jgi:Sulfotransferase family
MGTPRSPAEQYAELVRRIRPGCRGARFYRGREVPRSQAASLSARGADLLPFVDSPQVIAQLDLTMVRRAPSRAGSRLVGYFLFEGRPLTTKGRWWNSLVFQHLRFVSAHAKGRVREPIFVVGMGRSGTTLLGRILTAHPEVGFLNEPKAAWHVIRDDEDIIGSYAPNRPGRLHLQSRDADIAVIKRAHSLFSWYLRMSRSKRLVDKYPELVFRTGFVQAIFPDARFLVAVRSPWPTIESVGHWSKSHEDDGANWWGLEGQKWGILWKQGVLGIPSNADIASLSLQDEGDEHIRAAVEWAVTMRAATGVLRENARAAVVSYDSLVQRPRSMVQRILDFSALPPSARTEAYADAIVAPQGTARDPTPLISKMPPQLVAAVEETWAKLTRIADENGGV